MTTIAPLDFILATRWADFPENARATAKLNLLDTLGIAAGGYRTKTSRIIREHAPDEFGGRLPLVFDHRTASASGVALAMGMMVDSLDGHDGFNPAKGHIGCPLISALIPVANELDVSGLAFLEAIGIGYEIGARTSVAQHGTCPDYHTSGSWGAVAAAAAVSRLMGLDRETTRHAIGIAEYHGPRSQMMRCIDFPTMLKDGSGWGAMCGVSAAKMAAKGFTGAPAITVEQAPEYWADLGERWYILEQYYKPYPVCRWAQAPIEGVLELRRTHNLVSKDVEKIVVSTFHESIRLATSEPKSSDEAQYSTSFPCAVAMVRGTVTPADVQEDALRDPEILRLSRSLEMTENDRANELFPGTRIAQVTLHLTDGRVLQSAWNEPKWDPTCPPSADELKAKYRDLSVPVLGETRSNSIEDAIEQLDYLPFSALGDHLFQPIND
jgi:2-methylcitrate dehydratase PrpD